MLIDWFTVGAQALNFVILVWLLKRFLYRPVLDALHAREERIARELADADAKQAQAQRERDEYQRRNEEFDAQRAAILNAATAEATKERRRLLEEAQKAADALREKRSQLLVLEARSLESAVSARAQQEVFAMAKKVLTDLAAESVEARALEVFARRLQALDPAVRTRLAEALDSAHEPALVRSAFALTDTQRESVRRSLNAALSREVSVRFEIAPELICGVEFTTQGQKLAWSVADYLGSLEKGVRELVKGRSETLSKEESTRAIESEA